MPRSRSSRASHSPPTRTIHATASSSGVGVEPVERLAAAACRDVDEPRVAQRGEVLRDRLPRHRQLRRELVADASRARERLEQVAPGRVGERVEDVGHA